MSKIKELGNELESCKVAVNANVKVCHSALAKEFKGSDGEISRQGRIMQIYLETVSEKVTGFFEQVKLSLNEFQQLEEDTEESRDALGLLKKEKAAHERAVARSTSAVRAMNKERQALTEMTVVSEGQAKTIQKLEAQLDQVTKDLNKQKSELGELASLRALNPHKMKTDHERVVKKLNNKIERTQELLTKANDEKKQATAVARNAEDKVSNRFGKTIIDGVKGREGINYRVMHYNYPAEYVMMVMDDIVPLVRTMEWHLKVMSTDGLMVAVNINECLVPIFPYSTEMKETWPKSLTETIETEVLARAKKEDPGLVKKRLAAKEFVLTTNDAFTDSEKEALKKAKYITMLDVAGRTRESIRIDMVATKKLSSSGAEVLYKKLQDLYKKHITVV